MGKTEKNEKKIKKYSIAGLSIGVCMGLLMEVFFITWHWGLESVCVLALHLVL